MHVSTSSPHSSIHQTPSASGDVNIVNDHHRGSFNGISVEAVQPQKSSGIVQSQRIEELFQSTSQTSPSSTTPTAQAHQSVWLTESFSACYNSMAKLWALVVGSGKLDLDPRYANNPLPHVHGINGLSNHHGTCYLNTTLQTLAQTVRLHLEHGNCSKTSQNFNMMEAISEKMPTLMSLVNGTLMKDRHLKRLYIKKHP